MSAAEQAEVSMTIRDYLVDETDLARASLHATAITLAITSWLAGVTAERDRLLAWKAEALPAISGLQELGRALNLRLGTSITGPDAAKAAVVLVAEGGALAEAVERVRGQLPDECWVSRSDAVFCTDFIGAKFGSAIWTVEMCCLPCRIRAALSPTEADR